ncbi:type II toxin-antitoxin system HicB family antitoxin [Enterococcus faecium]|uniref:type II toxin-antitoxin system HicB family antitoxin n=1 Tax=Enterococcus faecium TaxID=1352 RepID=UPI003514885D
MSSLRMTYPAIFQREDNGGYFIDFPDIQGAYTGINKDDLGYAVAMAEEVLGMVLSDYVEHGETLPKASNIKDLAVDSNSFATLISVDLAKYLKDNTLVKKTLTIPRWASDLGNRSGINFSKLLTEAIVQNSTYKG